MLALVQGRLGEAVQHSRDGMAAAEAGGLPGDYLRGAVFVARIDVEYRNRPAAGLREVAAALTRHALAPMPAADRPYADLATFYARAGRVEEARRLMAEYERVVSAGLRRGNPLRRLAEGDVALAEGRRQAALAGYRAFYDEADCGACGFFEGPRVRAVRPG